MTEAATPTEVPPTEKAEGEETPAEFVPLTSDDIEIPEGLEVNEAVRDEFLGVLNNRELDLKGQANALLALQAKVMGEASEAGSAAWNQQQTAWQDEVKADPEVGGAKLQGTLTSVGKLVEEFGSPELKQVFDLTGAGNSVHVVRFLNKLAGQLTERSVPQPGQPTSAGSTAARLYPSMKG